MNYEFRCSDCGEVCQIRSSVSDRPDSLECALCGGVMKRSFSCNFVLGSGFPSRDMRVSREITKRNERAGRDMRKEWNGSQPKLVDTR